MGTSRERQAVPHSYGQGRFELSDHAQLGVALIGCGNFARRQHLPNLMRIQECKLVSVCDVDAETASACREKFGAQKFATNTEAIWEDDSIGLVVICVRDDLQADLAVRALQAGKHVYVEKPLGTSAAAFQMVEQAQLESGKRLTVGFQKRFAPIYQKLKEVVLADGGPKNIYARMADDAWRWAGGYEPGYLLQHDMCHLFDLIAWLCGSKIQRVACAASRADDDAILLTLENGTVATLMQSGHATMDMPKEHVEIITNRGGAVADDFVELRTFGYPQFEARYTFEGHCEPGGEYLHKPLFAKQGIQAMLDLRRIAWELRERRDSGSLAGRPDEAEARAFIDKTLPNFLRDQGWLHSMQSFIQSILHNEQSAHADLLAARHAAAVALAAVKSRASGQWETPEF